MLKSYATELVWEMVLSECWRSRALYSDQAAFFEASVQVLYSELLAWYTRRAISHPLEKMTRVTDFKVTMLGKTTKRKLSLKAAETKMFFLFLSESVITYRAKLTRGDSWCSSSAALCRFIAVLKAEPLRLSDDGFQDGPVLVETGACLALGLPLSVFHSELSQR